MLDRTGMHHRSPGTPPGHRRPSHGETGFTLLETLVALGVFAVVTAIAIGVSPAIVRMARGDSGAQELDSFLKRHREMAVARRRDIEIRFIEPNQIQSAERAVPDPPNPTPAPTVLETMTFEGRIRYWRASGMPDTPDLFGNNVPIALGGNEPVMFSSEGSFIDVDGNPVNATVSLGIEGDPLTATAVTILGTTATVQRWRWNGGAWMR